MSLTKRQIVRLALTEIGYSSYQHDIEPDQLQDAMHVLDAMMGEWAAHGIHVGYPIPMDQEDADLDADTGLPDTARSAVYLNLALRLCGMFGKQPTPKQAATAKIAYNVIVKTTTAIPKRASKPGVPLGQGHKYWRGGSRRPFSVSDDDALEATSEDIEA